MPNKRPSTALVIACLALFVALAGTGLAAGGALITSPSQIRNGVIQLRHLSLSARKALRGQQGPQGFQGSRGEQGLPGPQGPPGPSGGFDPRKIATAVSPQVTAAPNTIASAYATCPSGSYLISGGYGSSIGIPLINGPATAPPITQWRVDELAGSQPVTFFAIAICTFT